jgi:predicted RNA-binding protein YlxR (DUF448 family)/ribosomal protein L30E
VGTTSGDRHVSGTRPGIPKDEVQLAMEPQRRCIATGAIGDRSRLLRFVVSPGGEIVPDVASNLPGRGLWLTPRRDIVERAVVTRRFGRAARRPVSVPPGLADCVEALLAQRCCDAIGLARRAGLAVAGFEKVCEAIRAGKAALVVAALDGAAGGRAKIRAVDRDLPLARVLTAAEMGAVFGRDHVVHVALGGGRLSSRFITDAEKLAGFRSGAAVYRGEPVAPGPVRHEGGIGVK